MADPVTTGLGTGASTSRLVVTDFDNPTAALTCKLRHIDDGAVSNAAAERFVVGSSDESGTLAIQPRHSTEETGFARVFNVRAYGAVGDGSTDDILAFERALAAMGPVATAVAIPNTIFVPQGKYRLSRNLDIERQVLLKGVAPGASLNSCLVFDPYACLRFFEFQNSPSGGDASGSAVENLAILGLFDGVGGNPPIAGNFPVWTAMTAYAAGVDRVLDTKTAPSSNNFYYYECIRTGTSGGGPASPFSIGTQLDFSEQRQDLTPYKLGDVVRVTSRLDYVWQCIGAGTSAVAEPADFAAGNVTFMDGTVTWDRRDATGFLFDEGGGAPAWSRRTAPGILAMTRIRVERVLVQSTLNAAFHFHGDNGSPIKPANTNGFSLSNVQVFYSGAGVYVVGDDANAGLGLNVDVTLNTDPNIQIWPNEVGIADDGFLGSTWVACQVAACGGPGYRVGSSSSHGAMFGCYLEGDSGAVDVASNAFGIWGGNTFYAPGSTFYGALPRDWHGVEGRAASPYTNVLGDVPVTTAQLTPDANALYHLGASDESFYHRYEYGGIANGRPGWWSLTYAMSSTFTAFSLSGARSPEGIGLFWLPRGYLMGTTTPFYVFGDDESRLDGRYRYGARIVGDRVQSAGYVAENAFADRIVTTAGWDGVLYDATSTLATMATLVTTGEFVGPAGQPAFTAKADIGSPGAPDFQVYMCIKDGSTSGGGVPAFASGTVSLPVRAWQVGNGVVVGTQIRPSALGITDELYVCTAISGGALEAQSSGPEPAWPGAGSINETPPVGPTITWTFVRAIAANEWIGDGTTGWTLLGPAAVYSDASFVPAKGMLVTTTNAANQVLDTYPVPADATTSLYVRVCAYETAGTGAPDGAEWELKAVYQRSGAGAPVAVKAPAVVDSNPNANGGAWAAVLALNGANDVEVQVTGDTGKTITWTCVRTMSA